MKLLFCILFSLLSFYSYSQDNQAISFSEDSDTTFWFNYVNKQVTKFNLPDINQNKGTSFRLASYSSMIEVNQTIQNYTGSITFFIEEMTFNNDVRKKYKKIFLLDESVVRKLFQLIDSSVINQIPSDKFIQNWNHGFDGITYFFQFKDDSCYSFKNYWTPPAQSIPEAAKIQNFINSFYKISGFSEYSKGFRSKIPFRSYSYDGGSTVVCIPMTKKELREYKKQIRKK